MSLLNLERSASASVSILFSFVLITLVLGGPISFASWVYMSGLQHLTQSINRLLNYTLNDVPMFISIFNNSSE